MNEDISLALYLAALAHAGEGGAIFFCIDGAPAFLHGLPQTRRVFLARGGAPRHPHKAEFDWMSADAWADRSALRARFDGLGAAQPVFVCPRACIPELVLRRLHEQGYATATVIDDGAPATLPLGRAPGLLERWRAKRIERFLRTLLATRAKPLKMAGDRVFLHDSGAGYSIWVPELADRADGLEDEARSRLLLFEDDRLLGPAHTWHSRIRGIGYGSYSHWNECVLMSTSDNSDPNTNGRTYRYVMLDDEPAGEARALAERVGLLPPAGAGAAGCRDAERLLAREDLGELKGLRDPSLAPFMAALDAWLAGRGAPALPFAAPDPKRMLLMIGYLGPGGAERQICNLARTLGERGFAPEIMTLVPLAEDGRHYADLLLESTPVSLDHLGRFSMGEVLALRGTPAGAAFDAAAPVLAKLPAELLLPVTEALVRMLGHPPAAVVCYLDLPNVVGGLAALLAGVPRIVLSGRNLNPTHFPYLYKPWLRDICRALLRSPRVTMSANSHAGSVSYARWLGLPVSAVPTIVNGLGTNDLPQPGFPETTAFRLSLGLNSSDLLIAGVFRLSPEKRPLLFVEAVERIRARVPGVKAVMAGVGGLRDEVAALIRARGLQECIHMLGRRQDVNVVLGAADLLLHVAQAEGLPNVILEAQWLGTPVVCTRAGGTESALSACQRAYMHDLDDVDGVIDSAVSLLLDRKARLALSAEARHEVHTRFSLDALAENVLGVIETGRLPEDGTAKAAPPPRIEAPRPPPQRTLRPVKQREPAL